MEGELDAWLGLIRSDNREYEVQSEVAGSVRYVTTRRQAGDCLGGSSFLYTLKSWSDQLLWVVPNLPIIAYIAFSGSKVK